MFDMSLAGEDMDLILAVVNQGIDSRLEGFIKSTFDVVARMPHGDVPIEDHPSDEPCIIVALNCKIHPDEMQILLRRLEIDTETAEFLVGDIVDIYYLEENDAE